MELRKLLRDLKLNKYESSAYIIILKKGIVEANIISKEGEIPFGKVYESLGTLVNKGLIEVQDTRPKKYQIKKPQIAFKNFIEERRKESEKAVEKIRTTIIQLEEEISKIIVQEPGEKIFWTTAIGKEIEELIKNTFLESEEEICMLPYIIDKKGQLKSALLNLPSFAKEIVRATSREVKIKAILPEKFAKDQIKVFKKLGIFQKIKKNIQIRIQKGSTPSPFTLIDSEKVVLRVDDPTDSEKILAMLKISDPILTQKLKEKFNEMWESAEPISSLKK